MEDIKASCLIIEPCSLKTVRGFIEQHHYSGSVNGVKVTQCFGVWYESALVGAAIFGAMSTTAWRKFADMEYKVIELRRLALLDHAGYNSESRVIGTALRWIKRNTKVEIVVSYADPLYGHIGTIYKATNFQYVGLSGADKGYRDPDTGRVYHSRALRTKYKGEFKPFVKRLREKREAGLLEAINLPGKYCFIYKIRRSR